jgi:hypothetical protein
MIAIILGVVALTGAGPAGKGNGPAGKGKGHQHHKSGKEMLGEGLKSDGKHQIDKVGEHTVSVNVTNGKVAGVSVHHSKKGDVSVTKYKTNQKMAQNRGSHPARYMLVQQDLGVTYIGYSFIDDYGDEQIYWFPYEMIVDGATGAIDYVPLS